MTDPDKPLRWGILGCAKIALTRVIPALAASANSTAVAIASRRTDAAAAAAHRFGIARSYGSYAALIADPEIDVVYNPLPNHLHVDWTLRATAAGKHVLCEKPLALSAGEAARLLQADPACLVDEALMVRHHPQWQRVRALLREGAIGRLLAMHGTYSYGIFEPTNIRNRAETGGGGLYDVGSYLAATARFAFEAEPLRVTAVMDRDPAFGTDRMTTAILAFPQGHAAFTCGTQMKYTQNLLLIGSDGWIRLDTPFAQPSEGHAVRIEINRPHHARRLPDCDVETLAPVDQYQLMVSDFSDRVRRGDRDRGWLARGIDNMRVLDALRRAAADGTWQAVS